MRDFLPAKERSKRDESCTALHHNHALEVRIFLPRHKARFLPEIDWRDRRFLLTLCLRRSLRTSCRQQSSNAEEQSVHKLVVHNYSAGIQQVYDQNRGPQFAEL